MLTRRSLANKEGNFHSKMPQSKIRAFEEEFPMVAELGLNPQAFYVSRIEPSFGDYSMYCPNTSSSYERLYLLEKNGELLTKFVSKKKYGFFGPPVCKKKVVGHIRNYGDGRTIREILEEIGDAAEHIHLIVSYCPHELRTVIVYKLPKNTLLTDVLRKAVVSEKKKLKHQLAALA